MIDNIVPFPRAQGGNHVCTHGEVNRPSVSAIMIDTLYSLVQNMVSLKGEVWTEAVLIAAAGNAGITLLNTDELNNEEEND